MRVLVLISIIFALYKFTFTNAQQTFAETPRNLSVLLGDDVTLKCTVKNQKGDVIWCKEDFCAFSRKRNITDPRVSFAGNETLGENHLVIKNISISDDTRYQCQVLATEKDPSIKSEWSYLTVLIKPSSISISSNSKVDDTTIRLVLNQSTTLECNAENSNPGCSLVWFLGTKELKTSSEISGLMTLPKKLPSKLYKTTGKITIKPLIMEDWHSKYLKCECQNAFTSMTSSSIYDSKLIIFNYAPKVKINKVTPDDILVGSYIQFECLSDSLPPATNYQWSIGDKIYLTGSDEKYLFLKIDESMHKKNLNCHAKNDVSTQSGSYTIELIYGPKIKQELPSHRIVNIGEYFSMSCDVDSNPESSIIWTLNDTVIYYYPKLVINSFKKENYGIYKCIASLKDYPRVFSKSIIVPPGPPIIEAESIQYGYFGNPGSIQCVFEKEPKPAEIDWFKGNKRIEFEKATRYKLRSEEIDRKGLRSILLFKEIEEIDFGNYTCRGINQHGSSSFLIKFQPKEKEIGNMLSIFVVFMFLFISGIILGFFAYIKFTNTNHSRKVKRIKRKYLIRDKFRSKPSMMLNSNYFRSYPKTNRKPSRNHMNRLSNQNIYNNGSQNLQRLNEYSDIVDPRNLSQFDGNNLDLNYLNYEYGGGDNSNANNKLETSETSFLDPIEAEYNYLNSTHYQTDV
ncbi:unnamed protein product [Brachionus calyciflorus]|uniref:Ig-like domain-containing protein n=1 Tax=Brachionus calyciflorus TaxID=104777 RepID=A0A813MM67_9BILA|nr:unnamed protein product [Brachionus calyciflorus]